MRRASRPAERRIGARVVGGDRRRHDPRAAGLRARRARALHRHRHAGDREARTRRASATRTAREAFNERLVGDREVRARARRRGARPLRPAARLRLRGSTVLVNAELLRAGYAVQLTVPPNVRFATRFAPARARCAARGHGAYGPPADAVIRCSDHADAPEPRRDRRGVRRGDRGGPRSARAAGAARGAALPAAAHRAHAQARLDALRAAGADAHRHGRSP